MAVSEKRLNEAMGRALSGYRGELQMSQGEFGMLLGGIGQRTVSQMESGERAIHAAEVVLFAAALSTALPYTKDEIKDRFLDERRLSPVDSVDSVAKDRVKGGSRTPRAALTRNKAA